APRDRCGGPAGRGEGRRARRPAAGRSEEARRTDRRDGLPSAVGRGFGRRTLQPRRHRPRRGPPVRFRGTWGARDGLVSRRLALLLPLALLAACGQKRDLVPAPGQALPPTPYGADHRPTAEELLEPDPQAAPERSVELRKRSEEREDDPFDLPP